MNRQQPPGGPIVFSGEQDRGRQHFSLDVAQAAISHSRADITEIYTELDIAKAVKAVG